VLIDWQPMTAHVLVATKEKIVTSVSNWINFSSVPFSLKIHVLIIIFFLLNRNGVQMLLQAQ